MVDAELPCKISHFQNVFLTLKVAKGNSDILDPVREIVSSHGLREWSDLGYC